MATIRDLTLRDLQALFRVIGESADSLLGPIREYLDELTPREIRMMCEDLHVAIEDSEDS